MEPNRYKKLPTDPDMVPKWPTQWVKFEGDIVQKAAFDFDKIYEKARQNVGAEFDTMVSKIENFNFRLWSEITEEKGFGEDARVEYNSQQAVIALREYWIEAPDMKFFRDKDREGYVRKVASTWVVPRAFVHEGKWYQKGGVGWFGTSHGDIDQDDWHSQFVAMLNNLKDTDYLTVVDCHI